MKKGKRKNIWSHFSTMHLSVLYQCLLKDEESWFEGFKLQEERTNGLLFEGELLSGFYVIDSSRVGLFGRRGSGLIETGVFVSLSLTVRRCQAPLPSDCIIFASLLSRLLYHLLAFSLTLFHSHSLSPSLSRSPVSHTLSLSLHLVLLSPTPSLSLSRSPVSHTLALSRSLFILHRLSWR